MDEVTRRERFLKDHHPGWGLDLSRAMYEELKTRPHTNDQRRSVTDRHLAAAEAAFSREFGEEPLGFDVGGVLFLAFPKWAAQNPDKRPTWWGEPGTNFPGGRL